MKTITTKRFLPSIVGLALAMIGTSASATFTWNYDLVGSCTPSTNQGTYVAECTAKTNPDLDLTMSGWSTAPSTLATAPFAAAKIYDWGANYGLGVVAGSEPNTVGPHSIDNQFGTDAILLGFDRAVALDAVKIGWNGTSNPGSYDTGTYDYKESSDISVLAYMGTTPPTNPTDGLNNQSIPTLLASGWKLIGNYGQVGRLNNVTNPDHTALIASTVASSWWLISAYNPSYTPVGTTPVSSSGYALTKGNDYFKLLSVAGGFTSSPGATPEPGSIALAGLGLMGLLAFRRRQKPV